MMVSFVRGLFSKKHKSAGIEVTAAVWRLIRQGDVARDVAAWGGAIQAYRAALDQDEGLRHIWIQLGHASKEHGDLMLADAAYRRAAELDASDPEPHVLLAHLHKRTAQWAFVVRHFLHALHLGSQAANLEDELRDAFYAYHAAGAQGSGRPLVELLREEFSQLRSDSSESRIITNLREAIRLFETVADAGETRDHEAIVYDISDLVGYYQHARSPTGIQRVQIELIEGAIQDPGHRTIYLCTFDATRDAWIEVPVPLMHSLIDLSIEGGDREENNWRTALEILRLALFSTKNFIFPRNALLINLGTSWWLRNYLLHVRYAKITRQIRYIPFVHDLIPIMTPEYCVEELIEDFISWMLGAFDHADYFLTNSETTKRDLITVAAGLGHEIGDSDVAVIPLDADSRRESGAHLPVAELVRWGLQDRPFVLFVATIEPRKGHLIAFDAWSELLRRHGGAKLPKLVCVGNRGWLNDRIYQRITLDATLADQVVMLSHLADEELSLLYTQSIFTLYPSFYEGWGLPVTESLCHGKVPLVSDASALREAGGRFAVYAQTGSVASLAEQAERLIFDGAYRSVLEKTIATGFRPRKWSDLARQIETEIESVVKTKLQIPRFRPFPRAQTGKWYPLTRIRATRIWPGIGTAEAFRSNLGWQWPEDDGCRIKPEGGELAFAVKGPHGPLKMCLKLQGDEKFDGVWSIRAGPVVEEGRVGCGSEIWAWMDIPANSGDSELCVRVRGTSLAPLPPSGNDGHGIGVAGFLLLDLDRADESSAFAEALMSGRMDGLDAFGSGLLARDARAIPA